MFLPTKAHKKEIIDGQYRIRLGNKVPKGAVNLAYTNIQPINSKENILITDLSDSIIENTQASVLGCISMHPNSTLLLESPNGDPFITSEDVLVTNIFKDNAPLFYSYQLAYKHYDEEGPDKYGFYNRNGISIIDRYGNRIKQPYMIQLIKDKDNQNLYYVKVFTSLLTEESDTYRVIYNAIEVDEDGTQKAKLGYKEALNLKPAFTKTTHGLNVINSAKESNGDSIYHQANGYRIGTSQIFVSRPRVKDTREFEVFRYQIMLEATTEYGTEILYSPIFANRVLHADELLPHEETMYVNGSKPITTITAEELMRPYIPSGFIDKNKKYRYRYFVRTDNLNVIGTTRVDGSSLVYAKTEIVKPNNHIAIQKDIQIVKESVDRFSKVSFQVKPIRAGKKEYCKLAIIMDNSRSMASNDEGRITRLKILDYVIKTSYMLYDKVLANGYRFERNMTAFRQGETDLRSNFIDSYSKNVPAERDVTRPNIALKKVIDEISKGSEEESKLTIKNHRYILLVTDGNFDELKEFEELLGEARSNNITVGVVAIRNYETLYEICKKKKATCIDGTKPQPLVDFENFFFNGLSSYYNESIGTPMDFTVSYSQGNKKIGVINKDSFELPVTVENEKERFAIELVLEDETKNISIMVNNDSKNQPEYLRFGRNLITVKSLMNIETFSIYASSNAYDQFFSPTYAVLYNDKNKIKILPPREKDIYSSWYLRIQNGRFDRTFVGQDEKPTYHYSIPEYYRQIFIEEGYPYRRVENERPIVLSENRLQVMCAPLYCKLEKDVVKNIEVLINNNVVRVKEWESFEGVLTIDGIMTANDDVRVSYEYTEKSYVYKGYYNEEEGRYFGLDLNPTKGHYITIRDPKDNQIKDVPSYQLINTIIYIYIKPSSRVARSSKDNILVATSVQQYTLFHAFERLDSDSYILLGEVRVRPNSRKENIEIIDTRTRGGGLLESITKEKMHEIEEESLFYWDIGHWDGHPYSENGVIVVRLSKYMLKEYGGSFTKQEVEEKLNRYLGYGILAIIEFIEDSNGLLQVPKNLTARIIEVSQEDESIVFAPTFSLN